MLNIEGCGEGLLPACSWSPAPAAELACASEADACLKARDSRVAVSLVRATMSAPLVPLSSLCTSLRRTGKTHAHTL